MREIQKAYYKISRNLYYGINLISENYKPNTNNLYGEEVNKTRLHYLKFLHRVQSLFTVVICAIFYTDTSLFLEIKF